MRNLKSTDRFKIWEIKDNQGWAEVRMSESRKMKEDNSYDASQIQNGVAQKGYVNTNWYFVRFVGHAYNKLKEMQVGDSITNLSLEISKEPYYGDMNAESNAAIDTLERANVIVAGSISKLAPVYGVVYPRYVKTTVFAFSTLAEAEASKAQEQNNGTGYTPKNIDVAPKVAPMQPQQPVQPQVTPTQTQPVYAQPVTPIAPTVSVASDECPF